MKLLAGFVSGVDWPSLTCPTCHAGVLEYATPQLLASPAAVRSQEHEGWDPTWLRGTFAMVSQCSNSRCRQSVVFAGDWEVVENNGDPKWGDYGDLLRIRTAVPPLPLIREPAGTPDSARAALHAAAGVVWTDPGSAAGRLRTGLERILDDQKIADKRSGGGRISAHDRVVDLGKQHTMAGDALMAVKWIGNEGAHDDELTASDVVDGAAALELALQLLYDSGPDPDLLKYIQAVIAAKGVPGRP